MEFVQDMKTALFSRWTLMRALRVLGGGWFLVYGITQNDWLYGIAGGYFFLQGLFNLGCTACSNRSCEIDAP